VRNWLQKTSINLSFNTAFAEFDKAAFQPLFLFPSPMFADFPILFHFQKPIFGLNCVSLSSLKQNGR